MFCKHFFINVLLSYFLNTITQRNIPYQVKRLGFVSKLSVLSPHALTQNQLKKLIDMELISFRRNFNWLDNLITGDEK